MLKNGQWVMEPVYLRWADSERQLVAALHTPGAISGIRLYHAGSGTAFRKPTGINGNPPATAVLSPEVPVGGQPVGPVTWTSRDVVIQNASFEKPALWEFQYNNYFSGWHIATIDGRNDSGFSGVVSLNKSPGTDGDFGVSIGKKTFIEQVLNENLDTKAKYQLSVATFMAKDIGEHLQLLAGDTVIGDMALPVRTAPGYHWQTSTLQVEGKDFANLAGESLRIRVTPENDNNTDSIELDNFHLEKLTATMASFAAPAGDGAGSLLRGKGEGELTTFLTSVNS